jgi:hypothetical protein
MSSWQAWREAQLRRRTGVSWAIAGGSVLILFVVVWILSFSGLLKLSDTQGDAIAVKLGRPDGENLPMKITPMPDPAFVPETTTVSTSSTRAVPAQNSRSPNPSVPSVAQAPSAQTGPASSVASASPAQKSSQPETVHQRVVQGQENGNVLETVFEGGAGHVGRSLYVPIYLYMPLPTSLSDRLVHRIPPSSDGFQTARARQENLEVWYHPTVGGWRLRVQPPLDQRPALWIALQDAGYDVGKAEYKTVRTLAPVTLHFTLSSAKAGRPPELLDVTLVSSSGDAEVDRAVVYGFRMSAFANGTGQDAQGVFTYDFSGK